MLYLKTKIIDKINKRKQNANGEGEKNGPLIIPDNSLIMKNFGMNM
mgnify:CR=1 FL=1